MKWLMRLNILAIVVYASFTAAIVVADIWIFPKLDSLAPPPAAVGVAIRQADDIDGLREIALVLFDHVTAQAHTINELVDSGVFWTRLHFLVAMGLACVNVALLIRLRRNTA
jgi:hypothetical protein